MRPDLNTLAENLANFIRTLTLPKVIESWSLKSLPKRLIKTGTHVVLRPPSTGSEEPTCSK